MPCCHNRKSFVNAAHVKRRSLAKGFQVLFLFSFATLVASCHSRESVEKMEDFSLFAKGILFGFNEMILWKPQFFGSPEGIRLGLFFHPGPVIIPEEGETDGEAIEPRRSIYPKLLWRTKSDVKYPYLSWEGETLDLSMESARWPYGGWDGPSIPFGENWWWYGFNRFPEGMFSVSVEGDPPFLGTVKWEIIYKKARAVVRLFSAQVGLDEGGGERVQLGFEVASKERMRRFWCLFPRDGTAEPVWSKVPETLHGLSWSGQKG